MSSTSPSHSPQPQPSMRDKISSMFTPQNAIALESNDTGQKGGFMDKIKKYGPIGIGTYLTISWTCLGIIYLVISRTGQAGYIIRKLRLEKRVSEKAGALAVTLVIYKAIIPLKIALTMMILPTIIDKLGIHIDEQSTTPPSTTTTNQHILSQAGVSSSIKTSK